MRRVDELIGEAAALAALSEEHRATMAGCATLRVLAPDELVLREGDPADAFFLIRTGAIAIETAVPGRGAVPIETLHEGDLLGWSWLVPPFRTAFDARALGEVHVIAVDGACLRGKCEQDPALGYDLLKLVAGVFARRLEDTRLRLLDLYGSDAG